MFGPFVLMDKSTLQGLGFECLEYLSRYYQHRVSPILMREITSDLADEKTRNKDEAKWKRIIKELAAKTQSSQSSVLPDALTMACNELLYEQFIPMNGYQAPRGEGIELNVPGMGLGIFFDEHPMMAILRNWAEGNFSEQDLRKAKAIRDEDSSVDLVSLYQEIEQETEEEAKIPEFQSLKEVVDYADEIRFFNATSRGEILRVARYCFQSHAGHVGAVMRRWRRAGRPALRYFAPYAMYFHRVEIVLHYCLLSSFVRRSKKGKAHLDMQYLYYLPFCHIFSSDDEDLRQLVPFFLRSDQVFVSKADLQQDLKRLSIHFAGLPEEEKKAFYDEHGQYPPNLEESFTANMWKKFMRPKRPREGMAGRPSPEKEAEIMKEYRAALNALEQQRKKKFKKDQQGDVGGTNPTINS